MSALKILSGGAAQGLVNSLAPVVRLKTGLDVEGQFGAVGAMVEKLRVGEPVDVVILTQALVATLAEDKLLVPSSARNVGAVETALAVPTDHPSVSAPDRDSLREALLAADAIYLPDIKNSTAGIHVAGVLDQLGISRTIESRLKVYPNGTTAMQHLGQSRHRRPIGCTQTTEIISTAGVKLSGPLPLGCNLATVYTAAIATSASRPSEAQVLVDALTARDQRELRTRAGFLESV